MKTLIMVDVWQWTPFVFIIVYARLQALPQDVFEAAQLDGATRFSTLRRVTLPLLMPAISFAAIFRAVDAFRSFDLIYGLSYGGPARSTTTLSFFSFQNGFQFQNYGYAAAVAYMMLIILIVGTTVLLRYVRLRPEQELMSRILGRVFAYLVLIALGIVGIAPFVYLAILSGKRRIEILSQVPPDLHFEWATISKTYQEVLYSQGMLSFTVNSVIVVGLATLLAILIGTPAAYAFSRMKFRGNENLANTILSMRFMPPLAVAIPLFLMIKAIHLQDTYLGLILPYTAFSLPLVVWIMIGFFDEIPREIDDAAFVDGCSHFVVLWRIMIPLVRPGIVTSALFGAIFIWNEFLVALYVIELAPIPDDLARRRDPSQRPATNRLEHRRGGRRRDRDPDSDFFAAGAALHRTRSYRRSRKMSNNSSAQVELVASGLGWPEGPTVLPDGRVIFVESYCSRLTAVGADRTPRPFAYVAGAPNSCVLGADGEIYVCQNGGTVGPFRAKEMCTPSIQRVREGGKAETSNYQSRSDCPQRSK